MIPRITEAPATIKFNRLPSEGLRAANASAYVPFHTASRMDTSIVAFPQQHTQVDGITYKLAETRDEREQAFRLVHDSYVDACLIKPDPSGMRITPYHFKDTTDVFVAKEGKEVIYTMTLIGENDRGLPLEMIYEHEVTELRTVTRRFGEVSCLASKRDHFDQRGMFDVFTKLVGLMFRTAQHNSIDKLLIAVHPRHARFYRRMLGFHEFGPLRSYSSVEGNPAIACLHDFAEANDNGYRLHKDIYAVEFPEWQFERIPMSFEDASYFSDFNQFSELTLAAA